MIETFDKQPLTKQLWFAMGTKLPTLERGGHGYCTIDMTIKDTIAEQSLHIKLDGYAWASPW